MPEHRQPDERPPINRRNTMIALGAIGAIILVSNLDGPNFDFGDSEPTAIVIDDGEVRTERINAALEKIPERIEAQIEDRAEKAGDQPSDDAELDAAVDELADGNPDRFVKWIENEVAER